MDNVIIKPYNIGQLTDWIKSLGTRMELYFDYVRSDFTAMVYHDSKNRSKVWYSKCPSRSLTEEAKTKFPDFSDRMDAMIASCVQNPIAMYLEGGEVFKQIVAVEYIPELKCVNFKTAGYVIGRACAECVYVKKDLTGVTYIINNTAVNITGDKLKTIAAKYLVKDIEDSNSLGYLYYNRSKIVTAPNGDKIKVPSNNDRRFGNQNNVNSVSNLMRNFSSFVPVAFQWSVYTPIWMQDEEFVRRLNENTVWGIDMVRVPNLTVDGYSMSDYESYTFYTTEKRVYQTLGTKFEAHHFWFYNQLVVSLFIDGLWYGGSKSLAVNKNKQNEFILGLEYQALTEDDKKHYVYAEDDGSGRVSILPARKYIKMFWPLMNSTQVDIPEDVTERITKFNLINIEYDLESAVKDTKNILNYID